LYCFGFVKIKEETMRKALLVLVAVVLLASSLAVSPVSAQSSCGTSYTVQPGDYLTKIARNCGVSYTSLLGANPQITNPSRIYPGQVLRIPQPGETFPTPTPVPGGSTYIVQSGDTMSKIAARFGISLTTLLNLNPQITNPSRIYPGQQIRLPGGASTVPSAYVSPSAVQAGATVTLSGAGFRANTNLELAFGETEGTASVIGHLSSGSTGSFSQLVTLPASAQLGKTYLFVVRTTSGDLQKAVSNLVTITSGGSTGGPGQVYYVQRGDTLRKIADRFGTTVAAILSVNPTIYNPNLIYVGQAINIPSGSSGGPVVNPYPTGAWVSINPTSGTPGSKIDVTVSNFPANQDVDIDLGLLNGTFTAVMDGKTDSSGRLTAQITLSGSAKAGELWQVRVRTTEITPGVFAFSPAFTVK